jgi:hypothetical protein
MSIEYILSRRGAGDRKARIFRMDSERKFGTNGSGLLAPS